MISLFYDREFLVGEQLFVKNIMFTKESIDSRCLINTNIMINDQWQTQCHILQHIVH